MSRAALPIRVDRSSPVPLYFQVAQYLEQMIESGELPMGARLDNEGDLAGQLGLSKPTMRTRGCWRPGMRRPARGTSSASPSRLARCCCTRPRPRWPAVNATGRQSGCSETVRRVLSIRPQNW